MHDHQHDTELASLLAKLSDLDLDHVERKCLSNTVSSDPDSMAEYLEWVQMDAALEWLHVPAPTFEPPEAKEESQETEDKTATPHTSVSAHHAKRRFRASQHKFSISIAVAVAVMTSGLLALHFMEVGPFVANNSGKPDEEEIGSIEVTEPEFIAKLTNWHNDKWAKDSRPPLRDPRLESGRRLVLTSGVAEITYGTGVRVVLEGPAEFIVGRAKEQRRPPSVRGSKADGGSGEYHGRHTPGGNPANENAPFVLHSPHNAGSLEFGKLVAYVPKPAKGFVVDTPFARVEDLGTEFGIEVNGDGSADVVVLTGKVNVVHFSQETQDVTPVLLTKSQGAFFSAKGPAITRRENADPERLALLRAQLDDILPFAAQSSGHAVEVANASFEFPNVAKIERGFAQYVESWSASGVADQGVAHSSVGFSEDFEKLGGHGSQFGYINGDGKLTWASDTAIQEGARYSLVVSLGRRLSHNPGRYVVRLIVDGNEVASTQVIDGMDIPRGTFKDIALSYRGRSTDGSKLSIQLEHRGPGQGVFDNVRLVVAHPQIELGEAASPRVNKKTQAEEMETTGVTP